MLGYYGWILPFDGIDHADIGKTGGRIYVHQRDVMSRTKLVPGDIVSFYLYADHQGLGAECCKLEQHIAPGMNADALEFEPIMAAQPTVYQYESDSDESDSDKSDSDACCLGASWNVCATEFVPSSADVSIASHLSPEATEFVPSATVPEFVPSASAPEFVPAAFTSKAFADSANILAINPAFLSDDESDDETSDEELFCYDGSIDDKDSDCDVVVLHAPLKSHTSSIDGSTSAGETSDSEAEDPVGIFKEVPKWKNLPPGFRPPPGLSLPGFEEA